MGKRQWMRERAVGGERAVGEVEGSDWGEGGGCWTG